MKLLIPLAYLNEACFLSNNTDEKKYKMALTLAQKIDLHEVLGAEFYEEIETQYDPLNDTLTTANSTLYEDYLKDYLAWATYHRLLGFSQSDPTPTGERSFNDDNSVILDNIALAAKEKNVLQVATVYRNRIINYLRNEQSKDVDAFPLWTDCNEGSFSWGISGVERDSHQDKIFSIYKAVIGNE